MNMIPELRDLAEIDKEDAMISEIYGVDEFCCMQLHPRTSFFKKLDFYLDSKVDDRYYVYRSLIWLRTIIVYDEMTAGFILSIERNGNDVCEDQYFDTVDDLREAYVSGGIELK